MSDFDLAASKIKGLYHGLGWPSLFAKIRLFTGSYRQLSSFVPLEGFIVDLGCGYGIFANLLGLLSDKRKILGLDLDKQKINFSNRGIGNVECRLEDIIKINIPPADCILLIHVLHHLDSFQEQEDLLAACFSKLKKGGRLIIAEINSRPWWKFILTRLADHLLYPGDKIYYRFSGEMEVLLKKFSTEVKFEAIDKGGPFSSVAYICIKK